MADKPKPEEPKQGDPVTVKHEQPKKPVVAPDGHVTLSQEDIDARNA